MAAIEFGKIFEDELEKMGTSPPPRRARLEAVEIEGELFFRKNEIDHDSSPKSSVLPKISEPIRRKLGVPDGMLNLLVSEVMLQGAGIDALIRKLEPTSVAQHVGMNCKGDFRFLASPSNHPLNAIHGHRCPSFTQENVAPWLLLSLQPA